MLEVFIRDTFAFRDNGVLIVALSRDEAAAPTLREDFKIAERRGVFQPRVRMPLALLRTR